MCPLYTKTFGGKIWCNLHSVSPGNIWDKKFKMDSLTISRQKIFKRHLVQKLLKKTRQISFQGLKRPKTNYAQALKNILLDQNNRLPRNVQDFQSSCTR